MARWDRVVSLLLGVAIGGGVSHCLGSRVGDITKSESEALTNQVRHLEAELGNKNRASVEVKSQAAQVRSDYERQLAEAARQLRELEAELVRYKPVVTCENYPSGAKRAEGQVLDGKKEGVWTTWYEDGTRETSCTYRNGLRDGEYSKWSSRGKLLEQGKYRVDRRDGEWTIIEDDSTDADLKISVIVYRDGEYIGPK